jgi:hypothetical protein
MKKVITIIVFVSALVSETFSQTYNTPDLFTNVLTSQAVTAGANSNLTSLPVVINPGFGIGLGAKLRNASTSANTNAGIFINVTQDGTNWPSPPAYLVAVPHVANTTNWWATNLPAAWFDGFMKMRVESVTNNDLANTVTFDAVSLSRKRLDY